MILTINNFRRQLQGKKTKGGKKAVLMFNGVKVLYNMTLAAKTFQRKGCDCVYCGAKGSHVLLDKVYSHVKSGTPKVQQSVRVFAKKKDGSYVRMTTDHIIPKAKGGTNNVNDNLQPMCFDCNQKKASKMPSELILGKKWWNKIMPEIKAEEMV